MGSHADKHILFLLIQKKYIFNLEIINLKYYFSYMTTYLNATQESGKKILYGLSSTRKSSHA